MMIPSERLIELRRRQVDRLQHRIEELERENDELRSLNTLLLKIIRDVMPLPHVFPQPSATLK